MLSVVVCSPSQALKYVSLSLDTDNQRVIIKVKDINDEPPYFINRPLPMQVNLNFNHQSHFPTIFFFALMS